MFDSALYYGRKAEKESRILERPRARTVEVTCWRRFIAPKTPILAEVLRSIVEALAEPGG